MPRYRLVLCPDDHAILREMLNEISESGDRIISVNWEPERSASGESAARVKAAGYSIVVEEPVDVRDLHGPHSGTFPKLPPGR